MTEPASQRGHRRRRWLWITPIVVLVICMATYSYLTDAERVRRIVEDGLERYAPGLVDIGSAEFSLFDGTVLYDVVVHPNGYPTGDSVPDLLTCPKIELVHDPLRAVLGDPDIDALIAHDPTCTILHARDDARSSLAGVMTAIVEATPTQARSVPLIELRDARVRVLSRSEDGDRLVEELRLNVRGRESAANRGHYDIVWESLGSPGEATPERGHSQIDMRTGALRNVVGGLPEMSIEAVLLAVNARVEGAGAWAERLGIGGKIHARDFDLTHDEGGDTRSATIDLTDLTLSIPCDRVETAQPERERYVRFDEVDGTAVVTAHAIETRFDGLFHGRPCQVYGTLTWQDDPRSWMDMGFELEVRVDALPLPRLDDPDHPEQTRVIEAYPAVARIFEEFRPTGEADVALTLAREPGPNQPVRLHRARVTPKRASIQPRALPCRIKALQGEILVSEDTATIRQLRGRHGDSSVTMTARFDAPFDSGRAEVSIHADRLPLNEELAEVVPDAFRQAWKQSGATGFVDVDIEAGRAPSRRGEAAPWRVTKTLSFDDLTAVFEAFPYPLKKLGGRLVIHDNRVVIEQLASRRDGHNLRARGTVETGPDGIAAIDVTIEGKNLEVDDELLTALPESIGTALAAFHPTGRFDLETRLSATHDAQTLDHFTRIILRGNSIRHAALPVDITDVLGEIVVDGATAQLRDVTGRHGTAVVRADGFIPLGAAPGPADLTLECTRVRPTDTIHQALPDSWREAIHGWSLDGELDLIVRTGAAADDPDRRTTSATVRLDGASVRPPRFPVPVENLRGTVLVDERGVRAPEVTGTYAGADLSGSFDYTFADAAPDDARISLRVMDLSLDDRLAALLPESVRRSWDRFSPGGSIDLDVDRLRYHGGNAERSQTWTTSGHAKLRDVSIGGPTGIDRAVGDVTFSGQLCDRSGGLALTGGVDLAGLRVQERKLAHVTGNWSFLRTARGLGRFALSGINAMIYDGALSASIELSLHPHAAQYELAANLRDADLAPLLKPDVRRSRTEPAMEGQANVQVELLGTIGDLQSRRGQGSVNVTGPDIYRMPIVLSMLQVLNLAMPLRNSFKALDATGYLVGDEISLSDARISGDGVMLIGQGTVTLPNLASDLIFVSVNPSRWGRVPVLNDLLDGVSRRLVALGVSGTLHDPIVRVRPFHGLAQELRSIFVKQKQKNRQANDR